MRRHDVPVLAREPLEELGHGVEVRGTRVRRQVPDVRLVPRCRLALRAADEARDGGLVAGGAPWISIRKAPGPLLDRRGGPLAPQEGELWMVGLHAGP